MDGLWRQLGLADGEVTERHHTTVVPQGEDAERAQVAVLLDQVKVAAEAAGVDLKAVSDEWAASHSGGPARARNIGWRHTATPWVSFLDDDVVPDPDWYACLLVDLDKAPLGCPGPRAGCAFPCPRTGGPPTGSAPREGWRPRPGLRRT